MNNHKMMCDAETGVCGVGGDEEMELIDFSKPIEKVDLYYVTDPICSHCWGIEPVFRRFHEQYGQYFNFHTVMGGLLEKWHGGPIDPANGINGPADVAGHWREVGEHTRMPIDGSLMIDDPVQSSFPPSRVYKVIQQLHGNERANEYLRRAREELFAFNRNIGEADVLTEIVNAMGLDGAAIVKQADEPAGHALLQEDFAMAAKLGARGFPTIIMINKENKGVKIVGSRPMEYYVEGLKQVLDEEAIDSVEQPSLAALLQQEKMLFSKEIEVMYDIDQAAFQLFIEEQLTLEEYEAKEVLGETYLVSTK